MKHFFWSHKGNMGTPKKHPGVSVWHRCFHQGVPIANNGGVGGGYFEVCGQALLANPQNPKT